MRIISRKKLRAFWERHPDARQPLEDWYRITKNAAWENLADTRLDFPHADLADTCTIFNSIINVRGNKYRLITKIKYRWKVVYIRFVLTHAEYNRGGYANDCAN